MCVRLGWRGLPRLPRVVRLPGARRCREEVWCPRSVSSPKPCATPSRGSSRARYTGADCAALTELLSRTANSCQVAGRGRRRESRSAAHTAPGFTNPVDWLARAAGSSAHAARAALGTMAAVKDCPTTPDALIAGKVSLAQAAQITLVPEDEAELLENSDAVEPGRVAGGSSRTRWLAAIPPDTLHARRREAREFVHWKNRLGMTCFRRCAATRGGRPVREADGCRDRSGAGTPRDVNGREVARGPMQSRRVRGARQRSGPAPRTGRATW